MKQQAFSIVQRPRESISDSIIGILGLHSSVSRLITYETSTSEKKSWRGLKVLTEKLVKREGATAGKRPKQWITRKRFRKPRKAFSWENNHEIFSLGDSQSQEPLKWHRCTALCHGLNVLKFHGVWFTWEKKITPLIKLILQTLR